MKLEHIAKLKKLSPYLKDLVSLSEREVPNVPECILVGYVDDLIVFAECTPDVAIQRSFPADANHRWLLRVPETHRTGIFHF